MGECVMETECTHCVHREVCGIKIEYLDLLSKLPEQVDNSNFAIKVSCRYHEDKPSIINRHCELY